MRILIAVLLVALLPVVIIGITLLFVRADARLQDRLGRWTGGKSTPIELWPAFETRDDALRHARTVALTAYCLAALAGLAFVVRAVSGVDRPAREHREPE